MCRRVSLQAGIEARLPPSYPGADDPFESGRPTPPTRSPTLPENPICVLPPSARSITQSSRGTSQGLLEGLRVEDSRIVGSSFTAADLNRLRLTDVVVEGSDFSGADMEEASLTRVTFSDCRMSGALFPRARMQDVTFSEVRLDQVNFRMIEGERVVFDHVNLDRAGTPARQWSLCRPEHPGRGRPRG